MDYHALNNINIKTAHVLPHFNITLDSSLPELALHLGAYICLLVNTHH